MGKAVGMSAPEKTESLKMAAERIAAFRKELEGAVQDIIGLVDSDTITYYNNLVAGFDLFVGMIRPKEEKTIMEDKAMPQRSVTDFSTIKPIEIIPDGIPKQMSQRDLIRRDIRKAVKEGVATFEFADDDYRYSSLPENAKETLKKWFSREVYYPASRSAKERLKDYIKEPFYTPMPFDYGKRAFSILSRKLEDRVHVYCNLNLEIINNIEQIIFNETLEKYKRESPEKVIKK